MKAIKITLGAVAGVVVAVLALLLIGVPAGFLLAPMTAKVEAATGYQLKAGSLKLGLWPAPAAELRDIRLVNARAPAPQTSIAAESLRAEFSLEGLLGGRVEINEVALLRPVVRSPLVRERSGQRGATPSASSASDSGSPPRIAKMSVVDATVLFIGAGDRVESRLDHINVAVTLAPDNQLQVEASAKSGGQALRLKMKGQVPSAGAVPVTFTFEAPGLLQGPVAGAADLGQTGSLIKINGLSGTVGTARFNGWASVELASKPFVKLDLDVQRLDIVAVGATEPPYDGAASTQADWDRPWSDASIDLDGLNFVDAEVQFSVAEFNIGKFRLAPVALGASLDAGVLRVSVARMGMHGGQVSGTVQIDVSGKEPAHAVQMAIGGVRALPLLSDVAQFQTLDGKMDANIDLRARGASERAVMSSLAGTIAVTFQDGELRNFNIAQMVRDLGAKALSGWQAGKREATDFTELSALFRVDAGRATTTNLRMLGPLVRVSGAGTADIGAKTLQFRLDPKLVLSLQGQGATADPVGLGVPVVVQGTWGKPDIYPDIAGVFDNPGAAFAKLRELAPALFGADGAPPGAASGNFLQGLGTMMDRFGGSERKDAGTPGRPGTPPQTSQPPQQGNWLRDFLGR